MTNMEGDRCERYTGGKKLRREKSQRGGKKSGEKRGREEGAWMENTD